MFILPFGTPRRADLLASVKDRAGLLSLSLASYARKLGYVHENEKLVRIAGMLPLEEPVYDAGTIVHAEKGSYIPEWLCKVLAIICGALSLIILSAVSRIPRTGRTAAVQQDTQTAQVQSVYSAGIALHTRQ